MRAYIVVATERNVARQMLVGVRETSTHIALD